MWCDDMKREAARQPALSLQPELYRIRDAAAVLGVSERVVPRFIAAGELIAVRLPGTGSKRAPVRIARSESAGLRRAPAGSLGPMSLFKRCQCEEWRCGHPWWYRFRLNGRNYRATTQSTSNTRRSTLRLASAPKSSRAATASVDSRTIRSAICRGRSRRLPSPQNGASDAPDREIVNVLKRCLDGPPPRNHGASDRAVQA